MTELGKQIVERIKDGKLYSDICSDLGCSKGTFLEETSLISKHQKDLVV